MAQIRYEWRGDVYNDNGSHEGIVSIVVEDDNSDDFLAKMDRLRGAGIVKELLPSRRTD